MTRTFAATARILIGRYGLGSTRQLRKLFGERDNPQKEGPQSQQCEYGPNRTVGSSQPGNDATHDAVNPESWIWFPCPVGRWAARTIGAVRYAPAGRV
jgi:hypothetical protein